MNARCVVCVALPLLVASGGTARATDWLQFGLDPQHSSNNAAEASISRSNVATLGQVFQATLPGVADGAPALLQNVTTPHGVKDLLFVTTKAGHIVALDARTGAIEWSAQYPAGSCRINGGSSVCYTTSSPALDPGRAYVYTYGLDGYVHKHRVGDGVEITTGGWPQLASTKPFNEKGSSPLVFATSGGTTTLYCLHAGYPGDAGDYQGHVTAINVATGSQKVFNAACSDQAVHFVNSPGTPDCSHRQTAIWARSGAVYDAVTDRIYMATGNGLYDGNTGGHDWSETVFALRPDGTGQGGNPLDTYTPTNFQALDNTDADLGSTAPAILPAPGYSGRLAVQSGKDANLRLINLANLSGQGGPGHVGGEISIQPVPQGGPVLNALAVWVNPADNATWVFVASTTGLSGLKLSVVGGVPSLAMQWKNSSGGSSPSVANGVLYHAGGSTLRAYNPLDGSVLWSAAIGGIHWESPVVVNGTLYLTDEASHLTAWQLPTGSGCSTGGTTLCVQASRFRLSVNWTNRYVAPPVTGVGTATQVTSDTGYFWFFNAANVELMAKVLDGRAVNGKFWVFFGALSDVEYTLAVTDTQNGATKSYFNASGNLHSVADVSAF